MFDGRDCYRHLVVCLTSCSFSCRTNIMSPGSVLGDWSASPLNVIFCPCLMPLSTCTSKTFTSLHTLRPSHSLQRSFSLITSPANRHQSVNVILETNSTEKQQVVLNIYPLHCSQCTQTASAEPCRGPTVWSRYACRDPYMWHTSAPLPFYPPDWEYRGK